MSTPLPDNEFTRENSSRAKERFLSALSDIMGAGTTVDTGEGWTLYPERALCRAAGCLLKGLMLGRYYTTSEGPDDMRMLGPQSTELTDGEMVDGMSAIIALLTNVPTVMDGFEYRCSHERIEAVEARRDYEVQLAGEEEVTRREAAACETAVDEDEDVHGGET